MKVIRVVGLSKAFGQVEAVNQVSFEVQAGSLVTLLGPSGCGKTTTLRRFCQVVQAETRSRQAGASPQVDPPSFGRPLRAGPCGPPPAAMSPRLPGLGR